MHGWININKHSNVSSFDIIRLFKKNNNFKGKIGHLGTLDPIATGVLPIAIGSATRLIAFCDGMDKSYTFTIKWGEERDTEDYTGKVINTSEYRFRSEEIQDILSRFIGQVKQVPPKFSAIKVKGVRAYSLMRNNRTDFDIEPRIVHIYELKLLSHDYETSTLSVKCGRGVYVRAIARDIAQYLGGCAHIISLRRDHVGPFHLDNAISIDDYQDKCLYAIDYPLTDMSEIYVSDEDKQRLVQGQTVHYIQGAQDRYYYVRHIHGMSIMKYQDGLLIPKRNIQL